MGNRIWTKEDIPILVFNEYRKVGISQITADPLDPPVKVMTPEGIITSDSKCRIAIDANGGIYPIDEEVFQRTYVRAFEDG